MSPCPGPLVAVESHRGEATTGRGMQVGSGRGEADFGAVVICGCFHGPSSPEHFYQRHSGQHLSCELVTAISPAFQGTLWVSPVLSLSPRAFAAPCLPERSRYSHQTAVPTPGVENRSRSPDSHFPPSFQACSREWGRQPCVPLRSLPSLPALPAARSRAAPGWTHRAGSSSPC